MSFTKEELQIRVGKTLREIRQLYGLPIETVAFEAEMEYNQLSRIERGKVSTTAYSIEKVCTALKVPLSTFFLMVETGDISKVAPKQ